MSTIKVLVLKGSQLLASLALLSVVSTNNSICWIWFFQPKEPEGTRNYRKNTS